MTKINSEVTKFLTEAVKTAHSVNVPNIVIDQDGLRGLDPNSKLVVILKPVIDIKLPFESLALGDVSKFLQRMMIHQDNDASEISLDQDDNGGVKLIKFKSKGLNIEYRCVKAALFNKIIPKKVNDTYIGVITLDDNAVEMLKKGANTMKSEHVLFYKPKEENSVQFVLKDDTKSEFTFDIEEDFLSIEEDVDITFANNYPVKTILSAMNDADNLELLIGESGTLTIKKNGIDIVIPRRLV